MNEPRAESPPTLHSGYSARDIVRAPGLLSLCRLPLALAFPLAHRSRPVGVALMMAAAASDILDGWVARRLQQETPTGAALDGLMDKLFACSVLATLVVGARLALLDALVLCTREIGEGLLVAFVLWRRPPSAGNPRAANVLGKAVTVLQFSTIVIVLLGHGACRPCVFATGACGALCAGAYWKREMGARRQAS